MTDRQGGIAIARALRAQADLLASLTVDMERAQLGDALLDVVRGAIGDLRAVAAVVRRLSTEK